MLIQTIVILGSMVVSIPGSHVGDRGLIPRRAISDIFFSYRELNF